MLSPEICQCYPAARRYNNSKSLIYSIGMTIFAAYTGKSPWLKFNDEKEYNQARFEATTYKYLLGKAKIPEKFRVFFRFTLQDDPISRWGINDLHNWCKGKHDKYVTHNSLHEKNNFKLSFG